MSCHDNANYTDITGLIILNFSGGGWLNAIWGGIQLTALPPIMVVFLQLPGQENRLGYQM